MMKLKPQIFMLVLMALINNLDLMSNEIAPIWNIHIVDTQPEGVEPALLIASVRDHVWKINREPCCNKTASKENWFLIYIEKHTAYVQIVDDMKDGLQRLEKNDNVVLYTHGFGTSFKNSIEGAYHLSTHYKNTTVVAYDWPSNKIRLQNSIKEVDNSSDIHQSVLEEFSTLDNYKTKTLLYFSLGNRFFERLAKTDGFKNIEDYTFDNIILNAAAVKSKNHNKWLATTHIAKQTFITTNSGDSPLAGASFARGAMQLGKNIVGDQCERSIYLDFSEIAESEHTYFIGKSELELEYQFITELYQNIFDGHVWVSEDNYVVFNNDFSTVELQYLFDSQSYNAILK